MSLTKAHNRMIAASAVNVDDYGAVGDGATDDTIAIQAAINTNAAIIRFSPDKTYSITSQINLVTEQTIEGNNSTIIVNSTTVINSAFYGVDVSTSAYKDIILNCNSKTISGFRIYADSTGCNNVWFDNCKVSGTATDATLFYGGIEVASLGGAAGTQNSDIKVTNCNFGPTGTHGCLIAYTDGVLFENNRIATTTNHGMEAVGCRDIIISNNTVLSCTLSGLGVGANCKNFVISGNNVQDCGGDGSITCEQNSVFGVISNNTISDAKTSGVNISYGTAGASPFDKVQGVVCDNNIIRAKSGVTTYSGVNVYSSTGAGLGEGISVTNNFIDGFNIGITYAYSNHGQIAGNNIVNLTGSSSSVVKATLVDSVDIINNSCSSDTGDHAYQVLSFSGTHSSRCNINGNHVASANSAAKAVVYIDGPNTFTVCGTTTGGALNYVNTASTAAVVVDNNTGSLAGSPYAGSGTYYSQIGSATSTTVGAAGPATALPATPLGYVTAYVVGVGDVKIPYYTS